MRLEHAQGKNIMTSALYKTDFYGWTKRQASLLQNEDYADLDLPNLIEEIEAMGRQQRQTVTSRLIILIAHLLKTKYQPERKSSSWNRTIINQRTEIDVLLIGNKSLRNELPECFADAYPRARKNAHKETGLALSVFPVDCLWSLDQILDPDWLP